jgi:hypothetical protein
MKFVHRIGFRASTAQRKELEMLGVNVPSGIVLPGGGDPLVAFDIDEDHRHWPILQGLFERWKVSDILRTEFSKEEIGAARWLNLRPDWHYGYPQPKEDEFGYLEATYELTVKVFIRSACTEYCQQCGIGIKQKAPFQMRGEPKWGRRDIFQFNWIFDEYFVTPEIWRRIFSPVGVEYRSVVNTRGTELKTVVQFVSSEEVPIATDGLET